MSPRVRRLTATLGALFAACVTMTSAFPGAAEASPFDGVPNGVTSITLTRNSADMKRIAGYWSPVRLKQAQNNTPAIPEVKPSEAGEPAPPPSVSPTPSGTGKATTAAAAAGEQATATTATTSATGDPSVIEPTAPKKRTADTGAVPVTVGKVFFRLGGKDYWCSASSVASANRNLVATAAHCAYDAKLARAAEYWIFIPGYDRGETPYGIYVGHSLNLHESFVGKGDYDYDYAFVTVHDGFRWKPGKAAGSYEMEAVGSLEDNVGGQGLAFKRSPGRYTFAFGYPAAPYLDGTKPFDGQELKSCDGLTRRQAAPARLVEYGIALKCGFTAGASGGPWLIGYDTRSARGYLNGVNSFAWDTDVDKRYDQISSPYFSLSTYVVYRYAGSRRAD
ncbi:serine protease [Planomonospora sp. ID91781]|uniref:trypsin-like serine peptidase n=1 Tax=Planomonospora sp. ID91781 TaxID=2738135 RepID=UPI0018C40B88|nr:serine protease [Planomonospora sp. ID91781]MBG0825505.1 serine protease [Planomonospora sp. ID91781]